MDMRARRGVGGRRARVRRASGDASSCTHWCTEALAHLFLSQLAWYCVTAVVCVKEVTGGSISACFTCD